MEQDKYVLVTGGVGFIGSHCVVELQEAGYKVVIMDNLINAKEDTLDRVTQITGKEPAFVKVDLRDEAGLEKLFTDYPISKVIHLAGLKAVGESTQIPIEYYENNIGGTLVLLKVMRKHNVKDLVFSSSATVYGEAKITPITEDLPLSATNPYGRTKLFIEEILQDLCKSDKEWNVIILRYFNPIGAHPSGLIGEDPNGIPNNLVPYVGQVATGQREFLSVYGKDYNTVDGTGVRDYIHVVDLAKGHIAAVNKLKSKPGCKAYNLGTGKGYSVLQVVDAISKASGKEIPYKIVEARSGDIGTCFADASSALHDLGWKAERGLQEMAADTWRWQSGGLSRSQQLRNSQSGSAGGSPAVLSPTMERR